jgi:hypothetical protein
MNDVAAGAQLIDLLSRYLKTPAAAAGTGGSVRLGMFFQCVGTIWGDGLNLGSCTLLKGGRLALTASHVVSKPRNATPYEVRLAGWQSNSAQSRRREVVQIHWISGEKYDRDVGRWPNQVGGYKGDFDRLALLVLKDEVLERDVWWFPYQVADRRPKENDLLLVAGAGELQNGNHPDYPWFGSTRFAPSQAKPGFEAHLPRRGDLFSGMPQADDSGGPVFWPPMADPFPPRHLRLIGVHSGRDKTGTTGRDTGRFVAIDRFAQEWFRRVLAEVPAPQRVGSTQQLASGVQPSTGTPFKWRGIYDCYTMEDPPHALNGATMTLCTKGDDNLLQHGTTITTEVAGKDIKLSLVHPAKGDIVVTLKRDQPSNGGYWYTNDTGVNEAYYLLLLSASPKPAPGQGGRGLLVHIEAFAFKSGKKRPTVCLIEKYADLCDEEVLSLTSGDGGPGTYTQDQDDEGNGHEPP